MKIERTKNSVMNIFWGTINKIVTILLQFINRTVMIYVLGAEYLGLNSLFLSILQVLSIAELGFGSALVFSMYKPIAEDDIDTVCALMKFYRRVYRIIGCIIFGLGIALAPFLPYLIKGQTYPSDVNIYLVYFICLFNTGISYFLFAYKSAILSAYQRNDIISNVSTILNIVSNGIQILLLLLTSNYYLYVIATPILTIMINLVNAYYVDKLFPQYSCKGEISKELFEDIKKRIIGLVSYKIYGVIFSSADTVVISAMLGLTTLAIFTNYNYILTAIISVLTILTTSITAGIGNSIVTESVEKNYADFKKFVFMNGWISSWCAVTLFCLYQDFMYLWVGNTMMLQERTVGLIVLYFFLPRVSTMTYVYREATGMWWEDRFRPIVATGVNLVLNIILTQRIGIDGVIISTLLCTIFINVPWGSYFIFKNYFKVKATEYYFNLLYYVFVTVLVSFVTRWLCDLINYTNIMAFCCKILICTVIPNILFGIIYHRKEEFIQSRLFIKRFWVKLLH